MSTQMPCEEYLVLNVAMADLHASESQPSGRAEFSGALVALRNSIKEVGLQYPPLVIRRKNGDGFEIVDGHRRIAAMKDLAWPRVPVVVSEGSPDQLFAAVCGTTKPVTATQWVEVFLKGGMLPSGPTKVNINKLNETVGREFLQELVNNKLSPQIWTLANRVMRYAEIDEERKPAVLRWILKHKLTRQLASYISGGSSPGKLRNAFEKDNANLV